MGSQISDYIIGHIRTIVPMGVGAAIVWLTDSFGIEVAADQVLLLTTGLVALTQAVYYAVVRAVAQKIPQIGILLGYNKKPAYFQPENLGPPAGPGPAAPVEEV